MGNVKIINFDSISGKQPYRYIVNQLSLFFIATFFSINDTVLDDFSPANDELGCQTFGQER